ncbi:MAG: NAD(P)-dependent oxidoreductase, partial [Spirochaetota bacterium]
QPLLERGAQWAATPAQAADEADCVITMVGYPADVANIYFGSGSVIAEDDPVLPALDTLKPQADGIIAAAKQNAVLIDMTTSDPQLAMRIAHTGRERNVMALDCPVSGGDVGARNAALSIMCGGDERAFERVRPILDRLGKTVVLQGEAGAGQSTKMCNQIAIASGLIGVCESMAYAENAGLDPQRVLSNIEHGAAGSWSLSNLAPRMIKGDFAPGFYVEHFIKDMRIAEQNAHQAGIETPGLTLARRMFERLAEDGHEREGTQALYRAYRKEALS